MDTVPEKPSDMIGYGLPRPGSQVREAFSTNMQKLGKSVHSAFSTGDDMLGNELTVLKQDIDAGRVPENAQDWGDWIDQRNDRLKQAQTQAYTALEGDTPENRAFAESNSLLGNPRHGALLMDYLQTRDPAVFDELRKNVSMTPGRAKLEDQQQRLAKDGNLAQLMNSTFGEGAGNYIIEAGDPLEVAGNLLPLFKGAKLVKAIKGGSKLKAAGEAITGAVGETASELGSQFMDDPGASWEQRKQVAKDAFIGSLGLGGLGAGAQMVRDRFVPAAVDSSQSPTGADAERKPSDDLPPQRWTPRGQTMADMPQGAELIYDELGRVSGWQMPKTALDEDLSKSIGSLAPELRTKSENILARNAPDAAVFLEAYREKHGNVIDADQMREMLRSEDVNDADFTVATDPLVAALSREATRQALDALPEGGNVVFLAGGPASGKSHALQQMPDIAANADVVVDAPMATYANAEAAVERALAKGARVSINYIHTPLEKATAFMMDRFEKTGRETNADKLADMHFRAQQTVMRLAREYADNPNFQVRVIDHGGDMVRVITPAELAVRAYRSLDEAKGRVHTQIDHEFERRKQNKFWTAEKKVSIRGGAGRPHEQTRRAGTQQAARQGDHGSGADPATNVASSPQFHRITAAPAVVTIPQVTIPRHPDGMVPALRTWLKGARDGIAARLRALTGARNPIDWSKLQSIKQGENPLHHFQAIAALPELYHQSVPVMSNQDEKKQSSTVFVKRYAWAVFPDGKRRHVLITAKNHPDYQAQGVYSVEAVEVRDATLTYMDEHARAAQPSSDRVAQPMKAEGSLDAFLSGIKPEHRAPSGNAAPDGGSASTPAGDEAPSATPQAPRQNATADGGVQGQGGNGGPGASSVKEWKKTTFGQRLKSDERLRQSWRQTIGGQYRVESEAEWQQRADDFLEAEGAEGAYALMTDPDSGLSDSDRVAIGLQLILHLDEQIKQTQLAGGDITMLDDLLYETAEWIEHKGTKLGQAVRVFGMWTRMSAEGVLLLFTPPCRGCGRRPRIA